MRTGQRQYGPLSGGYEPNPVNIVGSCTLVFCFLMSYCISTLAPNEYGVARNYLLGTVDEDVLRGGIHFIGPFKSFIKFPAVQVTTLFSGTSSADGSPIASRTGADPEDPDSGGQPVSVSCAFQFRFTRDSLRNVYLSWGSYEAARERFILLSRNMVSNTVQEFTPNDFWKRRSAIASRMLSQVNSTLWRAGATVERFEITKVEFAAAFEEAVTAIQVAEQQRVVNEYDQQVQQVVQLISVMHADNEARIANVSAGAAADAKELRAVALRDAFALKQGTKAAMYSRLQSGLGFRGEDMQEYFQIKAVQDQSTQGTVIVGVEGVEEEPEGEVQELEAPS